MNRFTINQNLYIERPPEGESVESWIVELPLDSLSRDCCSSLIANDCDTQFSRTICLGGYFDEVRSVLDVEDFVVDEEAMLYKKSVGWFDVRDVDVAYAEELLLLSAYVGSVLSPFIADTVHHKPGLRRGVGVVVESTRRHKGESDIQHEGDKIPLFSGTTDLEKNINPGNFGPHIDLTQSGLNFSVFASSNSGTIACIGEYSYLDPMRSQAELNRVGNSLERIDLDTSKVYVADSRLLLHDAPNFGGWRNLIRMFVGPLNPSVV